jgi:hypothetical protein
MTNKELILSIVSAVLVLFIVIAMTVGRPYVAQWKYFQSSEATEVLRIVDSLNNNVVKRDIVVEENEKESEDLKKERERIISNLPKIDERFEDNIADVASDDAVADFRAIDTIFSEHNIR